MVGGGVRIPAIQTALTDLVGSEKIARNVDGDEAAVFGAVYHAAAISAQFRTRRGIRIKDITERAVHLKYLCQGAFNSFDSLICLDAPKDSNEMVLFTPNSILGAKKLVTFACTSDFAFELFYPYAILSKFRHTISDTKKPIAKISVSGMETAKEKYAEKKINSIKIKGVVELTDSGILQVTSAYALFEIDPEPKGKLSETFDNVLNFFGNKKEDGVRIFKNLIGDRARMKWMKIQK